jgi:hypothetical protein
VRRRRKFQTLKDFIENLHKEGTGLMNYNGSTVPCIYVDLKRYESIISRTYGKKLAVDTLLNIFHDGTHVFVDIEMKFLDLDIEEYFLIFANDMLEFFEALSKTGLIAIVPQNEYYGSQNIFVIQIPKIELAKQAFEIIKSNAKK